MFNPSNLFTQGVEYNRTTQEDQFKYMCNFGARAECREGRRVFSYYLDIETTKDQCRFLNTKHLDCIAGYIMEDSVSDINLNSMTQI